MKLRTTTWVCIAGVAIPMLGWLVLLVVMGAWEQLIMGIGFTSFIVCAFSMAVLISRLLFDEL